MSATRPRRIIRRAVLALPAVVVLLVLGYFASWCVLGWLAARRKITFETMEKVTETFYAPVFGFLNDNIPRLAAALIGLEVACIGAWAILVATVLHDRQVAACRRLLSSDDLKPYRRPGIEWKLRMLESPEQRMMSVWGGTAAIILGILVAIFLPI